MLIMADRLADNLNIVLLPVCVYIRFPVFFPGNYLSPFCR